MKKWLCYIILPYVFLILLLITSLFYTETGVRLTVNSIQKLLTPELNIKNISGSLANTISLNQITYNKNQAHLVIKKLALSYKKIIINKFKLNLNNNTLTINGYTDKNWHIQWQLLAKQFNLTGAGTITGLINKAVFTSHFKSPKLAYKKILIRKLSLNTIIYLNQKTPSLIKLQADKFSQNAFDITRIKLTAQPRTYDFSTIKLINGEFDIPKFNLKLNNINGHLRRSNHQLIYMINGQAGAGKLKLTGVSRFDSNHPKTIINLTGKKLLLSNTKQLYLIANPSLKLNYFKNNININGNIVIPKATLRAAPIVNSDDSSDDIVYIENKKTQTDSHLSINTDLKIILGNQVKLNGFGIKAQLHGQLALQQLAQKAATADGELYITHGSYHAYGGSLTIKKGVLTFTHSLVTNPGINLIAEKTLTVIPNNLTNSQSVLPENNLGTEKLTVGINLTGTLKQPIINLFSSPVTLSKSNILSYLILGQPANQLHSSGLQTLMQAASSLNMSGGEITKIKQQLQSKLGLDELNITSEPLYNAKQQTVENTTALVLGKYLTPKLYLNYSVGLTQQENNVKLNYSLSHHWSLQTESSGNASGVDLLYTFEH